MEEWKTIPSYPNYEASNYGNVRGWKHRYGIRNKPHQLKPSVNGGYFQAVLSRKNKSKTLKVHRLVLEAFVGSCPDGMQGCHNDGNPANNHISNLRWDTLSGNQSDRKKHGTWNGGDLCPVAKLKESEVVEIRKLLALKQTQLEISKKFNISRRAISSIATGHTWKHVQ